ncbi:putative protein TPRXL [Telopea speciosissima]|uniref:putative protein TPRXL n=1 Tax=Telopea speciosissima TaxID=54955 RepID=UPI001CC5C15B|nr:putative protein TPRXL [Telopea speciosissima]
MDSGNSGSLQSSSGGDEEYDSPFLNPTAHVTSSSLFDPLSNYLDSFSRPPAAGPPPPNLVNLDMVWSRALRSEPTCTETPITGLMGSSSSSSAQPVSVGQVGPFQGFLSSSTVPLHTSTKNGAKPSASSSSEQQTNAIRNSKKRSRASRRAPTTVLTTDTSNFRAMVQEFTGIPAPPFSASPFPRSRFDLFSSTASTAMRSTHLESPLPNYLLRPFAQKFYPPSFAASSVSSSSIASTTNPTVTTSGAAISSALGSSNNHQQSLLSMQNPIFTFQSLLQASGSPPAVTPPRYPLTNVPVFGGKSQGSLMLPSMDSSQLRMGTTTGLEDFTIEKAGSENVSSSRGEGMVDSWICSSD